MLNPTESEVSVSAVALPGKPYFSERTSLQLVSDQAYTEANEATWISKSRETSLKYVTQQYHGGAILSLVTYCLARRRLE